MRCRVVTSLKRKNWRGILVDAGMISGSQLIYNMPNALGGDPRFLWDSDGNHVKVMI